MTIRVRPALASTGLWDDQNNMIDPTEAGLPEELVRDLGSWIDFFEYDCFEPGELKLIPEKAFELHDWGKRLTARIKELRPALDIIYIEINGVPLED
jgi:hypothetical protein